MPALRFSDNSFGPACVIAPRRDTTRSEVVHPTDRPSLGTGANPDQNQEPMPAFR
jgi:hypothetical protein